MKEFRYKVLMSEGKFVDVDNLYSRIQQVEYPKLLPIDTNFNIIITKYTPSLVISSSHDYLTLMGNLKKCILKEVILQL